MLNAQARIPSALLGLAATALISTIACSSFSVLHTRVSAPSLSVQAVDQLPAGFANEVLVPVIWEKFDYVYGEGGERREGLCLHLRGCLNELCSFGSES